MDLTATSMKSYGVFNNYPPGIWNPAFCGMMLWEISLGHLLNDFEINKFHNLRSGIILHGTRAYVFTQITNDDIHSHLKILIRGKILKNNTPTSKGATILRKYVRYQSREKIIPSIHQIQEDIYSTLGLSDELYMDEKKITMPFYTECTF